MRLIVARCEVSYTGRLDGRRSAVGRRGRGWGLTSNDQHSKRTLADVTTFDYYRPTDICLHCGSRVKGKPRRYCNAVCKRDYRASRPTEAGGVVGSR